jgi:hypothetical protein
VAHDTTITKVQARHLIYVHDLFAIIPLFRAVIVNGKFNQLNLIADRTWLLCERVDRMSRLTSAD